jgi:hypothetical protein
VERNDIFGTRSALSFPNFFPSFSRFYFLGRGGTGSKNLKTVIELLVGYCPACWGCGQSDGEKNYNFCRFSRYR